MRVRRILGIWGMLALLMFFNGALREVALVPLFRRFAAEILSAILGLIIVFGASRPFLREERPMTVGQVLGVSMTWFALTVAFDTGLGMATGQGWPEVLRIYSPWAGSLMPIILVAVIAAPFVWLPRRSEAATSRGSARS